MCLNCGCGEPDARHQPTDITREDLQRAADGSGMSMEDAARNVRTSLDSLETADQDASRAGATTA